MIAILLESTVGHAGMKILGYPVQSLGRAAILVVVGTSDSFTPTADLN